MKKLLVLMAFILLTGCSNSFSAIHRDAVENIVVWTHESERKLTEAEALKAIEQYNMSEYGGRATGEGGTPDFGLIISLASGEIINVNDFYGKVEVFTQDKSFYLENENLYNFVKELSES